ncbi:nucleolar protein 8 [Desmophyllum pertusum]|uniref:Nucleolar protein 8 n=1 Tax=Desmophyllum pertusum TaxID=174260 RepID=A0A9X0A4K5_9CNID|nr:nucleolar protein 8 [Desmophyllum pertusum]
METKRLFVGGLYSDIKEVNLRDRFKTFGTVSSVEIIRRTDEKGCPVKTFAYVDILQTEVNFRRCVSLLSNSKWKGCCLKIQAAKESFLTRLERERQQKGQTKIVSPLQNSTKQDTKNVKDQDTKKQDAIPDTLPKAVPGTPLPGKKNWVVGKFGRVLPVVYLRRRDQKKIAKFDPSKTTHCLKKIKPEEPTVTVSELTWSLDSETKMVNGSSGNLLKMKGEKQRKSKLRGNTLNEKQTKRDFPVDNGLDKDDKKVSEGLMGSHGVTFPSVTRAKNLSAGVVGGSESDSSASNSESDIDHHSNAKRRKNTLNNTEGNSSDTYDSSTSSLAPSRDVIASCSSPDTAPQIKTKLLPNMTEVESSSYTKIQNTNNSLDSNMSLHNNGTMQVEEDDEQLSDETTCSSTTSGRKSSDSSDETSDIESSESENVVITKRDQLSSEIDTKLSNISDGPGDSDSTAPPVRSAKTKDQSKITDNPYKQKHSNEKRLDALQEKKKSAQAQRNLIKDALKDLDSGTQSHDGEKHIVFTDSDDEDGSGNKVMKKAAYSVGDKISGSKASSWLGLDSDSDEDHDQAAGDDSDDTDDQLVTVKPHFEGKAGEELFKLQRTFGGDKRFELDSRFLEGEEDDNNHVVKDKEPSKSDTQKVLSEDYQEDVSTQKDDEISRSLTEEKEMAMKVLGNILGGNFRADYDSRESQEKVPAFRNSTVVHYDPTREDHKQFEQIPTKEREKPGLEPSLVQEKRSEDPILPEVSQDKYYDANTSSLTELFGKKEQGSPQGTSFTFLSQEPEDHVDSTAEEHRHVGSVEEIKTNPWQAATKLPYDSSDDNDDGDGDDDNGEGMEFQEAVSNDDQSNKSTSQLDELFFFHPDDPDLANRINDQEAPFMRTGSQEEVSEYWVSVRSDLTLDYKRKRKDAVRRQNKLAAKRTRLR